MTNKENIKYIAYIDGGRLQGTKQTVIGGILYHDDIEIVHYSQIGGVGKNHDAEWQSFIYCLKLATGLQIPQIHIKTDFCQISELHLSIYEKLMLLLKQYKENPGNKGLYWATNKLIKKSFYFEKQLWSYIRNNETLLKESYDIPPKYLNEVIESMRSIKVTIELIPREENTLADELCQKAKKKEKNRANRRKKKLDELQHPPLGEHEISSN